MFQLIRAAIMREYTKTSVCFTQIVDALWSSVLPERCSQTPFQSWFVVRLLNTPVDTSFFFFLGVDVLLLSCLNLSDRASNWLPGTNPYQPAVFINPWNKKPKHFYLKIQYVPRSKHLSSHYKKQSAYPEQLKICEKQLLASSYLSVRPSIYLSAWKNSVPNENDFNEIWYLGVFRKSVEKTQVSLQSDKSNRCFNEDQYAILIISRSFLHKMRNVSDKSCR